MVIVSKKHHELLISYYREKINKLPHGNYGKHNNKNALYITYDPYNPEITPRHKKSFYLHTEEGRAYIPLIDEYLYYKDILDHLMSLWNRTYWTEPQDIHFPVTYDRTPPLSYEDFLNARENNNPMPYKTEPIKYKGHLLRSKNELIACQLIEPFGYEYKTEIDLSPDEFTPILPDAAFYVPEIHKVICLEVDGALDQNSYFDKSERRKINYFKSGYIEMKDVIFYRLYNKHEFDLERLGDLINASILCNIRDIKIPGSIRLPGILH